jgi:hypothetical protein
MSPLKRTIPQKFEDGARNAVQLTHHLSKVFLEHSGLPSISSQQSLEGAGEPTNPDPAMLSTRFEEKHTSTRAPFQPVSSSASMEELHPGKLEDGEAGKEVRSTGKSIPSITEMLAVLRSLHLSPQEDGYCRIDKSEGLKRCRGAGLKVNHRILWRFDEEKSELLSLDNGDIKFRP